MRREREREGEGELEREEQESGEKDQAREGPDAEIWILNKKRGAQNHIENIEPLILTCTCSDGLPCRFAPLQSEWSITFFLAADWLESVALDECVNLLLSHIPIAATHVSRNPCFAQTKNLYSANAYAPAPLGCVTSPYSQNNTSKVLSNYSCYFADDVSPSMGAHTHLLLPFYNGYGVKVELQFFS